LPIGDTTATNISEDDLDIFGKLRIVFGDRIPDESNQLCLFCLRLCLCLCFFFFWLINFAIIRLITLKTLVCMDLSRVIDLLNFVSSGGDNYPKAVAG